MANVYKQGIGRLAYKLQDGGTIPGDTLSSILDEQLANKFVGAEPDVVVERTPKTGDVDALFRKYVPPHLREAFGRAPATRFIPPEMRRRGRDLRDALTVENTVDAGLAAAEFTDYGDLKLMQGGVDKMFGTPGWGTVEGVGDAISGGLGLMFPIAAAGIKKVGGKAVDTVVDALPKDTASRMKRMEEMGYDTDAYHGTIENIPQFEVPEYGAQSGLPEGMFAFSDNPEIANTYTSPMGVQTRKGQALEREKEKLFNDWDNPNRQERLSEIDKALKVERGGGPSGENVLPVKLRFDNPEIADAQGRHWFNVNGGGNLGSDGKYYDGLPVDGILSTFQGPPMTINELALSARASGKDGLIVKNVIDSGSPSAEKQIKATTYIAFDPSNIRSRFAEFDPAKKDLPGLNMKDGGVVRDPGVYEQGIGKVAYKLQDGGTIPGDTLPSILDEQMANKFAGDSPVVERTPKTGDVEALIRTQEPVGGIFGQTPVKQNIEGPIPGVQHERLVQDSEKSKDLWASYGQGPGFIPKAFFTEAPGRAFNQGLFDFITANDGPRPGREVMNWIADNSPNEEHVKLARRLAPHLDRAPINIEKGSYVLSSAAGYMTPDMGPGYASTITLMDPKLARTYENIISGVSASVVLHEGIHSAIWRRFTDKWERPESEVAKHWKELEDLHGTVKKNYQEMLDQGHDFLSEPNTIETALQDTPEHFLINSMLSRKSQDLLEQIDGGSFAIKYNPDSDGSLWSGLVGWTSEFLGLEENLNAFEAAVRVGSGVLEQLDRSITRPLKKPNTPENIAWNDAQLTPDERRQRDERRHRTSIEAEKKRDGGVVRGPRSVPRETRPTVFSTGIPTALRRVR